MDQGSFVHSLASDPDVNFLLDELEEEGDGGGTAAEEGGHDSHNINCQPSDERKQRLLTHWAQ